MAQGRPCMLRVPGICCHNPETTVLAHSNSSRHGKGLGMKATDAFAVWACHTCHSWLDQGGASRAVKELLFSEALDRMRGELEKIVEDPLRKAKDRDAAAWALERLQSEL